MMRNAHARAALLAATALACLGTGIAHAQDAIGGPAAGPNVDPDAPSRAAPAAAPARSGRKVLILPYVEVDQILDVPIAGGGRTLTFTDLQAGVDASVSTQRVQATVGYRYERQITESRGYPDQSVHTGIGRAEVVAVPNYLSIDAGALATRTRSSLNVATPAFLTRGDYRNVSQLYALEVGPSFQHSFGEIDTSAGYHFGLVHVDDGNTAGFALGPGQPSFEDYGTSYSHSFNASVGARPDTLLPFGWTISGGYVQENQHFLKARFRDRFVGLNVTQPVSSSLALIGDVGYEKLDNSQRQLLVDTGGNAILDGKGHLQGDPNLPRQLSYQQDGLFWDVGLSWRPNRRTSLEARVGRRYGEWIGFGTLDYQTGPNSRVQAGVYDDVQTFGHQLTSGIGALPTAFQVSFNPIVGNLDGCVFGVNGGQGGCLGGALQSINGNLFRARGVYALWSSTSGPWTYGVGANYDERRYLTPVTALGGAFLYARAKDRSASVEANVARTLSSASGIDGELYAIWYDSGFQAFGGTPSVYSLGATAGYHRVLIDRLTGRVAAGVYDTDSKNIDAAVSASVLVGARYDF